MKQSHFFAHLSRLKLINRWPLMRNVRTENVSEHSLQVAMVAHALAAIKNRKFGGNVNAERIALLAMYHDASEVLTGDLPTPVKYFNSQIAQEYKAIEKIAQQKLVDMVPEELRDIFAPLIDEHAYSDEEKSLVKQADALCAYLKCLEELAAGYRARIHWPSFYNVVTGKTLALPNLIALQHIPLSPAGVIAKRPAPIALPNSCAA